MDKTEPMKFTNPQDKLQIAQTLSLLTTLPFDPDSGQYDNKEVELDMAFELDGALFHMNKKVNLKDIITGKLKAGKFTMENPPATLHFRAEVKLESPSQECLTEKNIPLEAEKKNEGERRNADKKKTVFLDLERKPAPPEPEKRN